MTKKHTVQPTNAELMFRIDQLSVGLTNLTKEFTDLARAFNTFATNTEERLEDHSIQFSHIHGTLDEHTKMLASHTRTLNEHSRILNEHTSILNEHSAMLKKHTQILDGHTETLEHVVTNMDALKTEQASNIDWFKRQDAHLEKHDMLFARIGEHLGLAT